MRSSPSSSLAVITTSLLQLPSLSLRRRLACPAWGPGYERWFASTAAPPSHSNSSSDYIISNSSSDDIVTNTTSIITNRTIANSSNYVLPFRFETGVGLFAKRTPRPFPPPFHSPPSVSFSDPLSTHHQSRDRRAFVNGELIRGKTNGDDAVYASDYFIGTDDGVGAWATRPRGHAGLWARLILHFWSVAIEQERESAIESASSVNPDPVATLQSAYEQTLEATEAQDCLGTTTTCGAQLHFKTDPDGSAHKLPVLYVTNLGDCKVMVLRPSTEEVVYRTTEQWHWFDCPRQLGTNSPDTPNTNAVMDVVDLQVGDIVLAMSDGVIDNLWEHEIVTIIFKSVQSWESGGHSESHQGDRTGGRNGGMKAAANDLVEAAKEIATDPFAESPFMERAIEEGLASEGGKLDDISVIAALCINNEG